MMARALRGTKGNAPYSSDDLNPCLSSDKKYLEKVLRQSLRLVWFRYVKQRHHKGRLARNHGDGSGRSRRERYALLGR